MTKKKPEDPDDITTPVPTIPVPQAVADVAQKQFANRLDRLNRLWTMDAPTFVLANEIRLMRKALMLLDPSAVAAAEASREHEAIRKELGFCINDGCPNLIPRVQRDRDGKVYCESCEAEMEKEDKEEGLH